MMAKWPMVLGHRGWRAQYPENTLAGIRAAVDLGCEAVEFDVHLTADGRVVVIHDETADRTTDGTGCVHEMTLAAVKRLDAGSWFAPRFAGERVPTLEEVLGVVPPEVEVYVEVKDGRPAMVDALLPLVLPRGSEAVVHSFDAAFMARLRQSAPALRTGLLGVLSKTDLLAEARRLGVQGIHACAEGLTRETVAAWRAEGFTIMVWAARDAAECRQLLALEPDVIGTDCPDVLLKMRDA